ncbi:hypothetical protein BGZ94_000567 [Podila epigama]|nr:hypothetical protein BGZ94_000567 [Podila epigama]
MSPRQKPVLADITHRPQQQGRINNNSFPTSPLSTLDTCTVPGDENSNPARNLLEIFASVNNRKRSLKLTHTDYGDISSPQQGGIRSKPVFLPLANLDLPVQDKPSRIHRTLQPTYNLVSLTARREVFGRRKNIPVYIANEARNLAVGDEDGSIHIVDTKTDNAHPGKTIVIPAHKNAIFDLCWSQDDKWIISASGDKTARLHDVETRKCIGTFSGHNGTLKSVSMKHNDSNIFATSARDGAVMIWDVRCSSTTTPEGETIHRPANKLQNVHVGVRASPMKKTKQGLDGMSLDGVNSASCVQFMIHNEHLVASTGTQDGTVKYWDVRKHGSHFKVENPTPVQTSTYIPTTKRAHGLASMALSPDGSSLYAVSSDNHVYMYNAFTLGKPIRRLSGEAFSCSSYYIKISVSPDGDYLAAGSSKDLYVWEVNRPQEKPLIFEGPEKEVSGVDWAKDIGNGTQVSACSDDATVRTWRPPKV